MIGEVDSLEGSEQRRAGAPLRCLLAPSGGCFREDSMGCPGGNQGRGLG